jgi:hypothetical protein
MTTVEESDAFTAEWIADYAVDCDEFTASLLRVLAHVIRNGDHRRFSHITTTKEKGVEQ